MPSRVNAERTLEEWCSALPKIELHAHIHGSVRPTTLQEILLEEAKRTNSQPLTLPPNRTMDECFEVFHLIHHVVTSRPILRRIVIEAIEDFAHENVKYLELRSTPRALAQSGSSRSDYIAEVVSALDECHARVDLDIQVRLLISINRNQPVEMAEEAVELALEWKKKCPYIVGIDLSGHSERPDSQFHRFEHALEKARQNGLKLAVHFAEHYDDEEAERILKFRPDRLGHAVCLPEHLYLRMIDMAIPIEVCLTSNVHTLARYRDECACPYEVDARKMCNCGYLVHPHRRILTGELGNAAYPLCVCTDDPGVLHTNSSIEYVRAARAFNLDRHRLRAVAADAVALIFDPSCALALRAAFEKFQ
ncbi:TPA: hypothetical protein N0F65_005910 [Lagenidium giganteum]|uniref:Adenosine deaminase domain-containing protein n=1 Tax=Lagenidium giganteum TaxID=4803 RepID=A0AAV2ZCG7_9STRA|nr:TPA: hypothetical protein N0F65_005910 [Lagenidium giganteum]